MITIYKKMLICALAGLGIAASGIAVAQHHGGHGGHGGGRSGGHASIGFYIGTPMYRPAYYPYYAPTYYSSTYYATPYYPPVAAAPYAPSVYVENGTPPAPAYAPQAQQSWWYYCTQSRTYYPYVSQCAGGWQRVPAQPPQG